MGPGSGQFVRLLDFFASVSLFGLLWRGRPVCSFGYSGVPLNHLPRFVLPLHAVCLSGYPFVDYSIKAIFPRCSVPPNLTPSESSQEALWRVSSSGRLVGRLERTLAAHEALRCRGGGLGRRVERMPGRVSATLVIRSVCELGCSRVSPYLRARLLVTWRAVYSVGCSDFSPCLGIRLLITHAHSASLANQFSRLLLIHALSRLTAALLSRSVPRGNCSHLSLCRDWRLLFFRT